MVRPWNVWCHTFISRLRYSVPLHTLRVKNMYILSVIISEVTLVSQQWNTSVTKTSELKWAIKIVLSIVSFFQYFLTHISYSPFSFLPSLLFPPPILLSLCRHNLSIQTCGEHVTLDQPRLQHEQQVWHGTDKCFVCTFCSVTLVGQPYLPRDGKVFCSKDHAKKFKSKSKK